MQYTSDDPQEYPQSQAPLETYGEYLIDQDGEVILYDNFFTEEESDTYLDALTHEIEWSADTIKFFGKTFPLPRLTAWYGDPGCCYTYSGIKQNPHVWTLYLLDIKRKVEQVSDCKFNSVLLNQYRDGKDSVSWHSDDEPELGVDPIIASVSFGASRLFRLRHKFRQDVKVSSFFLNHGSLLIMRGKTQANWLHTVPKTKKSVKSRINLTFRYIYT